MSNLEKKYPNPTHEEQFDFLIRCYFGEGNDLLRLCVHRAYLDLNRTLHGIAKRKDATTLRKNGCNCVMSLLQSLAVEKKTFQKGFDTWHEQGCLQLQSLYRKQGFDKFSIGQAQKWLNMSLKYVFTIGEDRLPRFDRHYKYAHIPIDNVFLEAGKELGGPVLPMPWSRLDNYQTYLDLQQAYRDLFKGSAPLAAEFRLWLDSSTE